MFELNSLPSQIDAQILARALEAEPAVIGHFRLRGFPSGNIRPQWSVPRIAGTAVTLALSGADSALLHHVASSLRPGDVLLIDRLGDSLHACLGGGVAFVLKRRGVSGVIIDGPAADPAELREIGLPVWSRGLSAITTRLYGLGGAFNVPVSIGGAVANPGDLVIADEGGIVVIPPDQMERDIDRAIQMTQWEKEFLKTFNDAQTLGDVSGATPRILAALAAQSRG